MPILLAVSPFAAILSAPTTTASTLPCAISAAAAESTTSVAGRPAWTSSYAVSRDPVHPQCPHLLRGTAVLCGSEQTPRQDPVSSHGSLGTGHDNRTFLVKTQCTRELGQDSTRRAGEAIP